MKLFRSKPPTVPSELDLKLVEALKSVTECAEAQGVCDEATSHGREVLETAKAELGLRE